MQVPPEALPGHFSASSRFDAPPNCVQRLHDRFLRFFVSLPLWPLLRLGTSTAGWCPMAVPPTTTTAAAEAEVAAADAPAGATPACWAGAITGGNETVNGAAAAAGALDELEDNEDDDPEEEDEDDEEDEGASAAEDDGNEAMVALPRYDAEVARLISSRISSPGFARLTASRTRLFF